MAKISSKEVFSSTTIEGAGYTLRRVTEARRVALRAQLSPINDQIQDAVEEIESIEAKPAAERDSKRLRFLNDAVSKLSDQAAPVWIDWGLYSVDNLELDDQWITKDTLKDLAPKVFYDEIHAKIRERTSLGGAEIKNSESLSTSSAPVDSTTTMAKADTTA